MADVLSAIMEDGCPSPIAKSAINDAVFKAALAVRGCDVIKATILGEEIAEAAWWFLKRNNPHGRPHIQDIRETIKEVLTATGHAEIAEVLLTSSHRLSAQEPTRTRRAENVGRQRRGVG